MMELMFKHAWRKWEIASFPCIFTHLTWGRLEEWGMYAVVPKGAARTSSNNTIFSRCPLTPVMPLRWCTCLGHFPKTTLSLPSALGILSRPSSKHFFGKVTERWRKWQLKFHSPSRSTSSGSRTTKKQVQI